MLSKDKEIIKLVEDFPRIKRCKHCKEYFMDCDDVETHQSDYCDKCKEQHRGKEVIESE